MITIVISVFVLFVTASITMLRRALPVPSSTASSDARRGAALDSSEGPAELGAVIAL